MGLWRQRKLGVSFQGAQLEALGFLGVSLQIFPAGQEPSSNCRKVELNFADPTPTNMHLGPQTN